jgi:hypothetical protein
MDASVIILWRRWWEPSLAGSPSCLVAGPTDAGARAVDRTRIARRQDLYKEFIEEMLRPRAMKQTLLRWLNYRLVSGIQARTPAGFPKS